MKIQITIFIFLLFSFSTLKHEVSYHLEIKGWEKTKQQFWNFEHSEYETKTVYKFSVVLQNNTKKKLSFTSRTCSWQDFYFIDKPDFKKIEHPCEHNGTTTIEVEPNQELTREILFFPPNKIDRTNNKIKIGMLLADPNAEYCKGEMYFHVLENEKIKSENTIWTKEITID